MTGPRKPVSCARLFEERGNVWIGPREITEMRPVSLRREPEYQNPFPGADIADGLPGLSFFTSKARHIPPSLTALLAVFPPEDPEMDAFTKAKLSTGKIGDNKVSRVHKTEKPDTGTEQRAIVNAVRSERAKKHPGDWEGRKPQWFRQFQSGEDTTLLGRKKIFKSGVIRKD